MFDINGWELVIIVVVALLVIGPERLPQYLAKARQGVRDLRRLAEGAKTQLRDQMGPEFDNVDWSAYDPRQYDPRRIVRDALAEGWDATEEPQDQPEGAAAPVVSRREPPRRPTPARRRRGGSSGPTTRRCTTRPGLCPTTTTPPDDAT